MTNVILLCSCIFAHFCVTGINSELVSSRRLDNYHGSEEVLLRRLRDAVRSENVAFGRSANYLVDEPADSRLRRQAITDDLGWRATSTTTKRPETPPETPPPTTQKPAAGSTGSTTDRPTTGAIVQTTTGDHAGKQDDTGKQTTKKPWRFPPFEMPHFPIPPFNVPPFNRPKFKPGGWGIRIPRIRNPFGGK